MARTSLTDLLATPQDIDRARILATTEAEIRAQAVADGDDPEADAGGYLLVPPPHDLRRILDLTQAAFAALLRVPIGTVRNWEQGRTPSRPARRERSA